MSNCQYCNKSFETPINVSNKKFCSPLCRRRARTDRECVGGGGTVKDRNCPTCGALISFTDRRGKIYCSIVCKERTINGRRPSLREGLIDFAKTISSHLSTASGVVTRTTKGQEIKLDARVAPCLSSYNLFITDGYAFISYKSCKLPIHRIVYLLLGGTLGSKDSPIDHKNQDKLDNRIENLRLTTVSKNNANKSYKPNKSGYRGVYPSKKYWIARISVSGKVKTLGSYTTKEEAAFAYNKAALEMWGSDAVINKINLG